ncbi:MAG: DNA polymerase III subunit gamma/tau [Blastocatellia bacterium]
MSYQVIARKWRPQTFEEVTGQEHITQTLRNALEYDRLHHAYLFSGARGVGKTTSARLLAKALNCHKTKDKPNLTPCRSTDADVCPSCLEISESRSMDVLEIDAASHTGIDDVRDTIIENINVNPARDRYKVFIIDEVHQLSKPAFNALLKTLEEPPPNVVFVMATTELHKVPETILSRCQEFEFRTISPQKIFDRLRLIGDAEKIEISDDALREIARSGLGSMRDAQSNFDQVISFSEGTIEVKDVAAALGIASREVLIKTVDAVAERRPKDVLDVVDDLISRGHDLRNFCRDLMSLFRDLMVFKIAGDSANLLEDTMLEKAQFQRLSEPFSESDLLRMFNSLGETEARLKDVTQPRYALELGLVRLVEMRRLASIENIIERLAGLEQSYGVPHSAPDQPLSQAATAEKKTLNSGLTEADIPEADPQEPEDFEFLENEQIVKAEKPKYDLSFVDSLPIKLPPIDSAELEHFDDVWLDNTFEEQLALSGDDLAVIEAAPKLAAMILGRSAVAVAASANGASAPAFDISAYAQPVFEEDVPIERPVLSENPTEDELKAWAATHPTVRAAMRAFRAEIVSVKPKQAD